MLVGILDGKIPLWRARLRWSYTIKMALKHNSMKVWTGPGQGSLSGCCRHVNEPSIKGRKFLDLMSDCKLFERGPAP
jgi:hypothetical protein